MQALTPPAPPQPNRVTLWSALIAVYILWGSTYLFVHFMTEHMPTLYMASWRFLIAGSLLYAYARFSGSPAPTRQHWLSTGLIGVLLLSLGNGFIISSLRYLPTGMTALIGATLPIFLLTLNWVSFGKTRPSNLAMAGLLLGLAGVFLLIKPDKLDDTTGTHATLVGAGLIMIANLTWATGTLLSPRLKLPGQSLSTAMQMLVGGAVLLIVSLFTEPVSLTSIVEAPPKALYSLAYLVIFGSIIGFSSYSWLARNAPPQLLSTYAYVNPVVAMILGSLFAGEALTGQSAIGAVVIVSGVILITLGRK